MVNVCTVSVGEERQHRSLHNYEDFHNLPRGSATIDTPLGPRLRPAEKFQHERVLRTDQKISVNESKAQPEAPGGAELFNLTPSH